MFTLQAIRRYLSSVFIATLHALFLSVTANANPALQEALDNYQNSRFEIACKQFKTLAEMGFSTAQYNLGVMYLKGQAVEKDLAQAYAWMTLAGSTQASLEGENDSSYEKTATTVFSALSDANSEAEALTQAEYLLENYSLNALANRLVQTNPQPEINTSSFRVLQSRQPDYPEKAINYRLGGSVKTEFWVFPDGSVRLPGVVYSLPEEIFDASTLDAIKNFEIGWNETADPQKPKLFSQVIDYRVQNSSKSQLNPEIVNHFNMLRQRADKGDDYARYQIGIAHSYIDLWDMDAFTSWTYLLQAALQGVPEAQYVIGENLTRHWREEAEKLSGTLWIKLSASGDFPAIVYSLARSDYADDARFLFDNVAPETLITRAAAMDYPPAVIHQSMLTATARDLPDRGQLVQVREDLQNITGWYRDEPYWHIAAAFIAAAEADFAAATKHTQKAIRKAAALDWETDDFEQVLARFEQGERMILEPENPTTQLAVLLANMADED